MKPTKTTINWAILGTGNIAGQFATDLATVGIANCYAVASRTLPKAKEFADQYHFEKAYGSYEELVADPNVDAVYIATPHALHADNTKLCITNQIPVLCEKPFAMDSAQVADMIAYAKEHNVLLMEALWTRFLPHYQYVLDLLEGGSMGKVKTLTADFGFFKEFDNNSRLFNKSLGGGSLLDIGIYPIFAALTILGKPDSIAAKAQFFDNGADSECLMEFNYENGAKAFLKSTFLEKTPTDAVLECENGQIHINSRFHEPSTVTITCNGESVTKDFGYTTIGYNFETEHFSQLILDGKKESPLMSFEMSETIIGTLDTVRKVINLEYL